MSAWVKNPRTFVGKVSELYQNEMVENVKREMEETKEPFFFSCTGDTLVVGFRMSGDGELAVYNCQIRQDWWKPTPKPAPKVKKACPLKVAPKKKPAKKATAAKKPAKKGKR